jgi:hypothetical protein
MDARARPLVSVITATLRAAADLAFTARSLALQTDAHFEWIVADGGSRDGTVELLRRQTAFPLRWTSEPDEGIYDAWNKACSRAQGEWFLFLGAGDELATTQTLGRLSKHLLNAHPAHDLVYGRLRYISHTARVDLEEVGEPWERLAGRWELCRPALPPHAAVFHHRSLFDQGKAFDTRFRIVGDSAFLLRYGLRKPPLFVPTTVTRTPVGGLTMHLAGARAVALEIARMNQELGLVPPFFHRACESVLLVAKLAASRLPAPVGHRAADLYRQLRGQPKRWSVR